MEAIKPSHDLYDQQRNLEDEMSLLGAEMFRKSIKNAVESGNEDSTVYGVSFVDGLINNVVEGIEAWIAERESGKAGAKGKAYKYIKAYDGRLNALAFIALRLVVANLSSNETHYTSLAARIAGALEDEHNYGEVRKKDRKFYDQLAREAKQRSSLRVKRKVVNLFINRRDDMETESWPERDKLTLGALILELIIERTGLIYKETIYVPGSKTANSPTFILATEKAKAMIEQRVGAMELMRPLYEPMIVEPLDWDSPISGGYLTNRVAPVRFVKTRSRQVFQSLEEMDMTPVYEAVNAAQKTAWTINPFILSMLEVAFDQNHSIGGLPTKYDRELPGKPWDIDDNEEARVEWRKEAAVVHRENRENRSQRAALVVGMQTAHRYSMFDALYMPYQLDFRGRIYAVPRLNPQGPDWMKALLMFSEGKPIDEESAPFLAIQVANTGAFEKIDKASLEDRVRWVYENEDKILEVVEDPFANRWWTEADSPYCFLAACNEWAGYLREGSGFVSHLPVALDGSCSGIQHFSMALKDEVGGAAVNLIPADKPADIYSLVMDKAVAQVRADLSTGGDNADLARAWLQSNLLTRSCFKRPTMTFGYGSGQFGFRDQIMSDTLKPAYKDYLAGEGSWHFEDRGFNASLYLAKVTAEAVDETVLKAAECMHWLKKVAGVVTKTGLPVRWTTPDGFIVQQVYNQSKGERIDTVIFGSRVQMRTKKTAMDKERNIPLVDKRKQASGLSPNFVHSLDATHLRMAVRQAYNEGITNVALVHDSFGTHAADTGRFFSILRESLVDLYEDLDVIQDFYHQMVGIAGPEYAGDVPVPPSYGNLDRREVLNSDFAFA